VVVLLSEFSGVFRGAADGNLSRCHRGSGPGRASDFIGTSSARRYNQIQIRRCRPVPATSQRTHQPKKTDSLRSAQGRHSLRYAPLRMTRHPSADPTSLQLATVHKMPEALWKAVACYRFPSGQLAGRAAGCPPLWSDAASKLAGSKRQQAAALQSTCGAQVSCFQWRHRLFPWQRGICFS
jgi:hypothetical protein